MDWIEQGDRGRTIKDSCISGLCLCREKGVISFSVCQWWELSSHDSAGVEGRLLVYLLLQLWSL